MEYCCFRLGIVLHVRLMDTLERQSFRCHLEALICTSHCLRPISMYEPYLTDISNNALAYQIIPVQNTYQNPRNDVIR